MKAGLKLSALKGIFITHHHSDRNLDYGNLFYFARYAGLQDKVNSYGPPPLAEMTKKFFELNALDIDLCTRDEDRRDPRPLLIPHEIASAGIAMQDRDLKVTCVLADHPRFRWRYHIALTPPIAPLFSPAIAEKPTLSSISPKARMYSSAKRNIFREYVKRSQKPYRQDTTRPPRMPFSEPSQTTSGEIIAGRDLLEI